MLIREDRRHLNTTSDSEVLLNVFASELQRVGTPRVTPADIFAALNAVYRRCRGGYAVVAMIIGHGILGFRDPNGIRPLVLGERDTPRGTEWMLASESVALDMPVVQAACATSAPGEAVFIDEQGRLHFAAVRGDACGTRPASSSTCTSRVPTRSSTTSRCIARACAWATGSPRRSCASARITTSTSSSRFPTPAAPARCSWRSGSGVKYREGFIKNRYIGRTFIMPGQEQREKSVRRKLNAIDLEFRGKNVLLVDDSIVRGTTSAQIIELAREAGATQGVLRLGRAAGALPERLRHRHAGGAASWSRAGRSDEEVARLIGADWLIYQDLEDLIAACQHDDARIKEFDTSCFSGEYVTGDVTPEYLERLQLERSDAAKALRRERRGKLKVVRGT